MGGYFRWAILDKMGEMLFLSGLICVKKQQQLDLIAKMLANI